MKELVIVGGGFAGMWAALTAARENLEHDNAINIRLISADRYLTIRPRLYEGDPESLRVPLAPSLEPMGVALVEALVREIDTENRTVCFDSVRGQSESANYDRLILTAGSVLKELPIPGSKENAWNIDSFGAAVALDRHLQQVVKHPEVPGNDNIVIVGSGFTGIELATEMRQRLALLGGEKTAKTARLILVEQAEVVGPELGPSPRPAIEEALHLANVDLRTGVCVDRIGPDAVTLSDGMQIETNTTIVTAGMRANPLAAEIPADLDELGRLPVDEMLRVKHVTGLYAAGDIAKARVDEEHFALMSCQHAMPMGKYAGYNATRDLLGLDLRPYRQPDYVTCLDLGASGALFTTGWERRIELTGDAGKRRKQEINKRWIYPPRGDRDSLLAAAELHKRPGR